MFPYPSGDGPARRPPARLHRHRRLRAVQAHDRPQRAAHDGVRRVRAAGRAVRRADRPAPAGHDRAEHRQHAPPARRLGLAHDPRRSVATTDVSYYRWTQWIFLQIFNAWYDPDADKARPIGELMAELEAGAREHARTARPWAELSAVERRRSSTPTGSRTCTRRRSTGAPAWAPCWPTRRSPRTDAPSAATSPSTGARCKQWMMRITAYADRLLADLDGLDWPESIKQMQRNWIGRSTGASVRFPVPSAGRPIEVFTTRPDTLFGATYMVLAPEHPLVDALTPPRWPDGHARRRGPAEPRRPAEAVDDVPRGDQRSLRARAPGRDAAARPASSPAPTRRTRSTASRSRCSSPTTC